MKKIILWILLTQIIFATSRPLSSGISFDGNVEKGEIDFYEINASVGQTVEGVINNLEADADIYLKIGSQPSSLSFDCKSTHGSTSEDKCAVILSQNNQIFIAVYGFKATAYTVKATVAFNLDGIPLSSGIPFEGNVTQGGMDYYKVDAVGGDSIEAILDGLDADSDLYMKIGEKPLVNSFDCKSANGGVKIDKCTLDVESDSTVYIGIYGYKATKYKVRVGKNTVLLEDNVSTTGSVLQNEIKYYKIPAQFKDSIRGTIENLTADADILMKLGSMPTKSSYDCKSENGQLVDDSCSLLLMDDFDVYIGVFGFRSANYKVNVTIDRPIVPLEPTVYEDAESGPSTQWIHQKGIYAPLVVDTPSLPNAPDGNKTLVLVPQLNGGVDYSRYLLPINNSTQNILEMDCGGLPDYLLPTYGDHTEYRGFIPHYSIGVSVETTQGTRRMLWYSYFNHVNVSAFREVLSPYNIWLNYPSPVETTSGYYQPIDTWTHFRVDVEKELQKLEPTNRLLKINHLFATGGFLDNIKLSTN